MGKLIGASNTIAGALEDEVNCIFKSDCESSVGKFFHAAGNLYYDIGKGIVDIFSDDETPSQETKDLINNAT